MTIGISCLFKNMMQTKTHQSNIKKEHQKRKRRSQEHHCNWHLKKKIQKARMKNLLGHAIESLSICGIEKKGVHHHMFKIAGTHINEDY